MSDVSLLAEARAELAACQPKNRAEECVLEAISDVINPLGGAIPGPTSVDKLIEVLPPEALVKPETMQYEKIWTVLRSTLRCIGVEVVS
jgi:hypothetical protein